MTSGRNGHSKSKTPRVFLVDGMSFCYRAYFAIRSLSNSKGEPTNALYGFITMLKKLIHDYEPEYLAICFDRKEPTFRHKMFKEYKAHRKPMPEDLIQQIEPIKEFCRIYPMALYEKAGFEADDVIGTLARRAEAKGFQTLIVTGDKDAMQLVNDRIQVINPHKEDVILDSDKVRDRFDGLGPEKVVEVMALTGDTSDNIPGVRGIGEKTALKLIQEFGTVENLLKNIMRIKSKSQQTLIRDHEKDLLQSKVLVTIDTDVPIEEDWGKIKLAPPDEAKLVEFYKRYEFRTLVKDLTPTGQAEEKEREYLSVKTEKEFGAFLEKLKKSEAFSFDTETTSADSMRAALIGMSFSWEPFKAYYVPVSSAEHAGPGLPIAQVLKALGPILEDGHHKKYGQNLKYDWIVMKRNGITMRGFVFDTMLASYLVNPLKLNNNLDDITLEYLGVRKIPTRELIGSGAKQITMAEVPLEQITDYACEDADCVFRLVPLLQKRLEENGLEKLYNEVELPLALVLAKMEMNGVCLDREFLKDLSDKAGRELEALSKQIYEEAGQEFNINSTKQLGEILFGKLNLPVIRRTKTGYSTDVSVLEKLAENYELPKKLLEYREKTKLKSTYLDALPAILNPETGLIHTSYNQTVTATGRLSSSDPNLQNIPVKTEAGRMIRKAFVPRPGKAKRKILSADYSQIELRILAHLSGDKNLTLAFQEDRDIHRFTATLLYGVKEEEVTRQMRDAAKTINFSVIYGKTAFGLSQDLGLSISEADGFIENYFKRYKAVREYLDSQKEKARKEGYLTTLLGRRSYFPEIHSKNPSLRQFAERAAINAPIQGTAADLIKLAMIQVQEKLESGKLESLMIMQVHDELVFDMAVHEEEKLTALVEHEMQGAYKLKVPLKVDMFVGSSWYKS